MDLVMEVRVIRREDGVPVAAIKTVGTEVQWDAIQGLLPEDVYRYEDVPLFEDPEEFLTSYGLLECRRCGSWQRDPCICYAR
jgi:hypothetical protein